MTSEPHLLTPTYLMAAASSVLEEGGYQRIDKGFSEWSTATARLFEDEYNVVGVAVFPTCGELLSAWADLQASLVDVIARRVGPAENKAWDGYLVLMTSAIAPSGRLETEDVRYDTTRLRKLVITGENLNEPGDIDRLLRTLLPLPDQGGTIRQRSALAMLPEVMAQHGIRLALTEALVKAFQDQRPLMDAVHRSRADL